jgi:hypothetical protein
MTLASLGYPNIPKSITNPNVVVRDALDANTSLSFLQFIKTMDVSFNPSKNQDYYTAYLKSWNFVKNTKTVDDNSVIIERYREFIQDVNLEYTTLEEQKFLSKLDFNDPLDLDIAIPFYSRKLIEISEYYNKKREEAKFQITKKRISGTNFGLTKDIKDITINYLENLDNRKINYDFSNLKNDLEVEIEELYETYPEYFNQTPNVQIYDNKDLDYGLDIFLKTNAELIPEVFAGVSASLIELKEGNSLLDNKRKLTEKYISSNYYYLSTGSTVYDFITGKMLDADNPAASFFNTKYPTTASTQRKEFTTPVEMGFFRPHKLSIILIDGEIPSYSFNFDNLEPNTIYYFPDPDIRGNNDGILTFVNNDLFLKRNDSSGKAKNQPISNKSDSQYYGYISQTETTPSKYLDKVFESGYIQDSKEDIYNNLYGLFKNDGSFKQTIKVIPETEKQYIILDGHTFYDFKYGEGYAFDYSTVDDSTFPYTTRSGLSSHTGGFTTDFSRHYILFGGKFTDNFTYPPDFYPICQILEGYNVFRNGVLVTDTISSDLSGYPLSGTYYYSRLIEGGIHDSSPLQRALVDPSYPTLTANATQEIVPDEVNTFMIDGGKATNSLCDIQFQFPSIYYDPTVLQSSVYNLSSSPTENYFTRLSSHGTIYVRNAYTKEVKSLQTTFSYLSTTLLSSVYNELSGVSSFEVVGDTIFIQTDNNLIAKKILFDNGAFVNPKKSTYVTSFNDNPYQKVSKRFKKKDKVYYARLDVETYPVVSNDFKIYPTIYEIDTTKHIKKIYSVGGLTNFYTVSGGSEAYIKAEEPMFTYDNRSDQYNISFLMKTVGNQFIIQEFDFKLNPFSMINHKQIKQR